MKIERFEDLDCWKETRILILALCLTLLALSFILPEKASSGPYLNSAHSNTSYGVDRTTLSTFGYSRGNCVHCHEQHASIGGSEPDPAGGADKYALFYTNHISQTDNFCFKCHTDLGPYQAGGLVNRSYSYRAGGYTSDMLNDVKEAFSFTSPASSHNLGDIMTFINGRWGYTTDSNPCVACHNPHSVQGDPANLPNSRKSSGTRGWPVSRPSQYSNDNNAWGLWGDVATERMSNYAGALTYQASYATSNYEPDGSFTQDGSNLTDYVTFCTDCHNNINNIYSTLLSRNLYKFNWADENHGRYVATYCSKIVDSTLYSLLVSPYDGLTMCGQYVTACTDCHEPHGSPNNFLVRKQVNNGTVTVIQYGTGNGPDGRANKEWVYLCGKCHTNLNAGDLHAHPTGGGLGCGKCHPGGGNYRNCQECHYHGNSSIDGNPYGKPLF